MSLPDFIQSLKILDTHEHLAGCEADYLELKKDILQDILCSYIQSDLISAGMSAAEMKRALDVRLTLPERWNLVSPFGSMCASPGMAKWQVKVYKTC